MAKGRPLFMWQSHNAGEKIWANANENIEGETASVETTAGNVSAAADDHFLRQWIGLPWMATTVMHYSALYQPSLLMPLLQSLLRSLALSLINTPALSLPLLSARGMRSLPAQSQRSPHLSHPLAYHAPRIRHTHTDSDKQTRRHSTPMDNSGIPDGRHSCHYANDNIIIRQYNYDIFNGRKETTFVVRSCPYLPQARILRTRSYFTLNRATMNNRHLTG